MRPTLEYIITVQSDQKKSQRSPQCVRHQTYDFLSISLIFGAPEGVAGTSSSSSSSSAGIIGGLVASGDGPCVPGNGPGRNEPDAPGEYRLSCAPPNENPPDVLVGDVAGGDDADGVGSGGVPWLNSAQRGHFRFVSVPRASSAQA